MGIRRSFSKSSMSGLRGSLEATSVFSDMKKVIYFNSKETSYNIKVFIQLKMHSQVQIFIHFPHMGFLPVENGLPRSNIGFCPHIVLMNHDGFDYAIDDIMIDIL